MHRQHSRLATPCFATSSATARAAGRLDAAALRELEDRWFRDAIARQKQIGLKAVTDGEYRRAFWHFGIRARLGGVEMYEAERDGTFTPLRFMSKGTTIVLGLVTSKTGTLGNKDALRRRLDEAARHVPLEQLAISPQCGFGFIEEGNLLTEDEQWAKLARCVDVAREVRGEV